MKALKAIILAGGFGTRLRPLSCTRPKIMFPVANRLILDRVLENLSKYGVTHVVLAVNYLADALIHNFENSRYGMELSYSNEEMPLGTGGPIKKAEWLLNDDDGPFFVLNGDVLTSIDYLKLFQAHQNSGAKATIALHEVEDPSRFGVVEMNKRGQVLRFIEKPKLEETPSKLINAGVYVLDQSIFDIIPSGTKVSLERDIFPILIDRKQLWGWKYDGLWVDIGKPNDFLLANKLMLDIVATDEPLLANDAKIDEKAKLIPPVAIGDGVTIEGDACIGPYASIGNGVIIGKGTRIENSVIFPKAWIDRFTSIKGAIIGEVAIIGQWVKIEDGSIVGDHAIINDNVTLTKKVKVCPSKEVSDSILEPDIVM